MYCVDDLKLVHKVSGHEIYARPDLWCYFPIFDFFFILFVTQCKLLLNLSGH
jgi:hypothetical protein